MKLVNRNADVTLFSEKTLYPLQKQQSEKRNRKFKFRENMSCEAVQIFRLFFLVWIQKRKINDNVCKGDIELIFFGVFKEIY